MPFVLLLALLVPSRGLAQSPPPLVLERDALRDRVALLVRAGDDAAALSAIERLSAAEQGRVDVLITRAHLAASLDRHEAVAVTLAGYRARLPRELHPWASERLVRALLFLGQADRAEAELEAMPPSSDRVRALGAEAAAMRGDRARAFALATPLIERDPADVDTFALRSMLAELLHEHGEGAADRARAVSLLRELLLDRPSHPDAPLFEAELARWLGSARVEWSPAERRRRADRFIRAREPRRAVSELEAIPRPPASSRAELGAWHASIGEALFEARRYTDAIPALDEAARLGGEPRLRFLVARARLRAGQDRAAIAAFERFVREQPAHPAAAEAEWLAATTWIHEGQAARGRRALEAFVAGPRARRSPRLRREAEWQLAMIDFDAGHGARAADRFRSWGAGADSALDRARALYWEGRGASLANDRARFERTMRAAMSAEPLGWYALWAARRLRERRIDPGPPVALDPPAEASVTPIEEPPLVRFFASLGFDDDAAALLRRAEAARGRGGSRRAWAERFLALGDAERAYRLAGASPMLGYVPRGEAAWVWSAAYPRPFEVDVRHASSEAGVATEIVYAVMRQESAFAPRVVSRADAIGLLQLLPGTAEGVARRLGRPFGRELLYRPEHNVLLGASYLRALIDEVGVPLAFAAYNAGEHRVREWLTRAHRASGGRGQELDRFVEDIPFRETRNYIRRVTASYARYAYRAALEAGGDPSAWPELGLPERVGAAPPPRD